MGTFDASISLGEALVAGGTLALAVATFVVAWETRAVRREAADSQVRRALRAAMAEQLENCRRWLAINPSMGQPSLRRLYTAEPRMTALQGLLEAVDTPADLAAYLVWLRGMIADAWRVLEETLPLIVPLDGSPPERAPENTNIRNDHAVMVDRLQVTAALIAAEAARRGFAETAGLNDVSPWTIVQEGPNGAREVTDATDHAYHGAPPFPSDPAYADARPAARDRAGYATGERQRAELTSTARPSAMRPID